MGTRADFYAGRGDHLTWLGSIAWDGYPNGIDQDLLHASSEADYQDALGSFFHHREDVTQVSAGWPWPWDTSNTTDFAYTFADGMVLVSCFGSAWTPASAWLDDPEFEPDETLPEVAFPNMSKRRNMPQIGSKKSGLMVIEDRDA